MEHHDKQTGFAGVVSIIALIVAIIAIILAWMAYERTGAELDERIQEAAQQSVQSIEQGVENGADALDAGPDGVDEDDTEATPAPQPDGTVEQQPTTQP